LWHGAGCTFFVWGVIHGIFLLVNHIFISIKANYFQSLPLPSFVRNLTGWFLTMGIVIIGWVFFRSSSVEAACRMTKSMLFLSLTETSFKSVIFPSEGWYLILGLSAIALLFPNTQEFMGLLEESRVENKNVINNETPLQKAA